jgi:hypothetical protein
MAWWPLMGAENECYSSQHRVFKGRGTMVRECASRPTCATLYRADGPRCGPNTLHSRGECVVYSSRGASQPKLGRRFKPAPVAVASVASEEWVKQRRSTPARRLGRGGGVHGVGR